MNPGSTDVVIIGAPRSGTNMLRDVLTSLPGFGTWPCDEINPAWRHGNRAFPSDELRADHATPAVRAYMRSQFEKLRARANAVSIVEKTCANSLRVEFVHRVAPGARYIFISRDGLDVAASAMSRWDARLAVGYTAAKAKFVPPSDVPYYGTRFVANQLRKRRARAAGVRTAGWWGPKPHDWAELLRTHPLDEVCLLQWQRCVEVAQRGLATIPPEQVHKVSYESFVRDPEAELREVLAFLGREKDYAARAVASVSASSVGKGRSGLGDDSRRRLSEIGGETLRRLGYDQ